MIITSNLKVQEERGIGRELAGKVGKGEGEKDDREGKGVGEGKKDDREGRNSISIFVCFQRGFSSHRAYVIGNCCHRFL